MANDDACRQAVPAECLDKTLSQRIETIARTGPAEDHRSRVRIDDDQRVQPPLAGLDTMLEVDQPEFICGTRRRGDFGSTRRNRCLRLTVLIDRLKGSVAFRYLAVGVLLDIVEEAIENPALFRAERLIENR